MRKRFVCVRKLCGSTRGGCLWISLNLRESIFHHSHGLLTATLHIYSILSARQSFIWSWPKVFNTATAAASDEKLLQQLSTPFFDSKLQEQQ